MLQNSYRNTKVQKTTPMKRIHKLQQTPFQLKFSNKTSGTNNDNEDETIPIFGTQIEVRIPPLLVVSCNDHFFPPITGQTYIYRRKNAEDQMRLYCIHYKKAHKCGGFFPFGCRNKMNEIISFLFLTFVFCLRIVKLIK